MGWVADEKVRGQEGKRGAREGCEKCGKPHTCGGGKGGGGEDLATMASLGMIGVRIEK